MSDKRIIELDVTDVVEADDFLAIDSVSGTTRRIKPIKIGATYEIEDGDHEFTLVGSNGYSHTVAIPYDSVSMTQAEYDALTPAQKADGTARFITDADSDVESELWSKVGRQTLDTDSQVISNAVNELKGDIDTNTDDIAELESSLIKIQPTINRTTLVQLGNDYTTLTSYTIQEDGFYCVAVENSGTSNNLIIEITSNNNVGIYKQAITSASSYAYTQSPIMFFKAGTYKFRAVSSSQGNYIFKFN